MCSLIQPGKVEIMPILHRKVEAQSSYVNSPLLELAFQNKALDPKSYDLKPPPHTISEKHHRSTVLS